MTIDEKYMLRCLQLASNGLGLTKSNPLVGCVIVHENIIIGEGYHHAFGGPHAEVVAINQVKDHSLFKNATVYVNLEPCTHHGKTPPCSDLLIEKKVQRVVISNTDPFEKVNGKGIKKLRQAGIEVETGILEAQGKELNKRFFTFHEKKRPYIILKWAQSKDGWIDSVREDNAPRILRISGSLSHILSHQWRAQEMAIMVGKNTVLKDDPSLTTRLVKGENPIRIIFDRDLTVPLNYKVFDHHSKALVFNAHRQEETRQVSYIQTVYNGDELTQVMEELYHRNIVSVIVEGGLQLLSSMIKTGLWDEARIFTAPILLREGVSAPYITGKMISTEKVGDDELTIIQREA